MSAVETEPVQVPQSGGRTPKDMALSLGVLLIPVLLLVLGYRLFYGWDAAVTVDPTNAIESAGRASLAPLPGTAPDGWQTVTAKYADGVLRIGYLDPDGKGAQLVQSRAGAQALLDAELGGEAQPDGEAVIGGVTWQRHLGPAGRTALLRTAGNTATLLVGEGADLTALAVSITR